MRIAHVHASDFGGGAERSVVGLHRALRAAGHDSVLYVGERRGDDDEVHAIPYARGLPGARRVARAFEHRFGWQDIYNPSFRALARHLQGRDVLHFHSLWGSNGYADLGALPMLTTTAPGVLTLRDEWMLTGHCACSFGCQRWRSGCGQCPDLSIPPSVRVDGTAFNWRRKRKAVHRSRLHIVAISDHLKRLAEASPILSVHPIERIYNGIDLECFRPMPAAERDAVRAELGFDIADVVVVVAGQTVEGVRQKIASHHAIAALNELAIVCAALRVLVVGHSAALFARQLSAPSRCLDFQSEPAAMARLFGLADVCLVTSDAEAFGRIGAEAQACGTPVVARAVGGIPEVVAHEVGGLLAAPDSPAELLSALQRMCTPEVRARLARGGIEHVRRLFDQRQVAGAYLDLYQRVVGHG